MQRRLLLLPLIIGFLAACAQSVSTSSRPEASTQALSTPVNVALEIELQATYSGTKKLTYAVVDPPRKGQLSDINQADARLTYTPNAGSSGEDGFTFTVSDGELTSAEATVVISLTAPNAAPIATPQTLQTDEDTTLSLTLSASDDEEDTLSFTVVDQPGHGTLSGQAPNLSYTPGEDFSGSDSFTFRASDPYSASEPVSIEIDVEAVNDAPKSVALDKNAVRDEKPAGTLVGVLSAEDPDSDTFSYQLVAGEGDEDNASFQLDGDKLLTTASLAYDEKKSYSIRVQASDGEANFAQNLNVSIIPDVTSAADDGAGSLRIALRNAQAGDTISFDDSLDGETITLTTRTLVLEKDLVLSGNGVRLSGGDAIRVLYVNPNITVELKNMTVTGGKIMASSSHFGGPLAAALTSQGSGIYNRGDLTLTDVTVSGNEANEGGGVYAAGSLTLAGNTLITQNSAAQGGGIYQSSGVLTIKDNSSIAGNSAANRGGGVYQRGGQLIMEGSSSIADNVSEANAGGLHARAVTLRGSSSIRANEAKSSGGGVYLSSGSLAMQDDATISANRANSDGVNGGIGGGIYYDPATITGADYDGVGEDNIFDNVRGAPQNETPDQVTYSGL